MKKKNFWLSLVSVLISFGLLLSLASCGEPVEFDLDDEEDALPEFSYIIFPLLDEAQYVYDMIFSSVEYSNKTVEVNGVLYNYVESFQYAGESFESLIRGIFTPKYADEYIEMMFGGEEPLYIEYEDALYVDASSLCEYEKIDFGERKLSVSDYHDDFASIIVIDIDGLEHRYTIMSIDEIWYLDGYIEK